MEQWQAQRSKSDLTPNAATTHGSLTSGSSASAAPAKKKLSYLEAREYATIELRVEEAEQLVQGKRAELEDPANATNASLLVSTQADLDSAQDALDALYTRWLNWKRRAAESPQHRLKINFLLWV